MAYSTVQDALDTYPERALDILDVDGDGSLSADETAAAERILNQVAAKIDAYVGVKYHLPLAETPEVLRAASTDMLLYRAASTADRMTDALKERFKCAMELLKDISAGRASLGIVDPPVSIDQGVEMYANPREFSRARWRCL